MPDHQFKQKSREDLIVVATIAGLLTPEEAGSRTKPQLVALLEKANGTAAPSAEAPEKPAGRKPAAEKASKTAKAPKAAKPPAPSAEVPEAATVPAPREPSPVEAPTPVETPTPQKKRGRPRNETLPPEAVGAAPEALSTPVAEPAAEPPAAAILPRIGRAHRPVVDASTPADAVATPAATPEAQVESLSSADFARTAPAPRREGPVVPDRAHRPAHVRPSQPERRESPGPKQPDRRQARPGDIGRRPGPTDRRPGSPDNRTVRPEHRGRTDRLHRPERGNTRPVDPNLRVALPPVAEYLDDDYKDGAPPVYDEAGVEDRGTDENGLRRPPLESGEIVEGVLELMSDGYGFLRRENYLPSTRDIYVPPQYIRRFNLRIGDFITGPGKVQRESDRFQALLYIKEVNGQPPENMMKRPAFDKLTPIYPDQKFSLETVRNELSTRIIDLIAPIGKGQRGMIVSPPKAGKTILLQKIANAISINNPEAKLIVLLIDERPEEVTDMQRSINGEVVYSTFDKSPDNHVKVAELVLERAMRLVELGQDVVILMDSMTRLARAYNLTIQPTGRTLSGGLDPGALQGPKRFFGAARNIEFGGSLTIIATSLIETGSRMDEVIFEEFKGTGNMEVYLDRKLSEKRIFPAIDINKSGTRREELLLSPRELDAVWTIRKAFSQLDTAAVTEMIINLLLKTTNNPHFVSSVNVTLNDKAVFDAMRGTRLGGNGSPNGNPGGYNRGPMED